MKQPFTCYWTNYYRATAAALQPGIAESLQGQSLYLHDLLMLCLRGAWELELRQFMPPASLGASVNALLERGLIECVDGPPRPAVVPGSRVPAAASRRASRAVALAA